MSQAASCDGVIANSAIGLVPRASVSSVGSE